MPQNDSSVITQFQTPIGSSPDTATPGETITLSDQWAVSLDQNTTTGEIILTDTLNGVIPASDVVVNNGGSYGAGIITWDLGTFSGVGSKNGTVAFGNYTAAITVPSDYAQDSITSLASITPAPNDVNPANNTNMASISIVCFCPGTLFKTPSGNVQVEHLRVGDRVVTASGREKSIRWLGHRTVDCGRAGLHTMPVRIAPGAFGEQMPERDLYLSPGHPVLVGADEDCGGGHLVPIMCLINGTTIDRICVDEIVYWHIELDAHDILLAEGLPAESYLDWGDRVFFIESADHALQNPDFVVPNVAGRCRPVAIDGPVVDAERRRLDTVFALRLARAAAWPSLEDAFLSA